MIKKTIPQDKAVVNFFNISHADFIKEHNSEVVMQQSLYQTILTEQKDGYFPVSDFIVKYSGKGDLVMFVERVWRNKYSTLSWIRVILKSLFYRNTMRGQTSRKFYVSRKYEYIDIIVYKVWWYEWIRGLLKP